MDLVRFKADTDGISVDKKEILLLLERSENIADQHTAELVEEMIPWSCATAVPQGGILWMDQFRIMSRHQFQIGNEEFHVGPEIYRRLKDATSLVLFAVTAGPGPENLARELMSQGAYLEGYIADLIGTAIVEWAAEQLHQKVKAQAGFKGWKVTNRYSPGYCSWNVAEQQKLFHLIPPELCGIELSESSLMTPVKSVSGIIGAGNQVTFHANSCSHCPMKECAFRRSN